MHSILPPNDLNELEDDDEDSLSFKSYQNHLSPAVFRCIPPEAAITDFHLPVRLHQLQTLHPLKVGLREAYDRDYGMPDLIELGSTPIQWCRKLSFTDRSSESRFVFQTGDYVKLTDCIARLGFLFVHQLRSGARRVFAKVEKVERAVEEAERDEILDLPLLRFNSQEVIVGLPAIKPEKLYIVQVRPSNSGGELRLMHCEWNLEFL